MGLYVKKKDVITYGCLWLFCYVWGWRPGLLNDWCCWWFSLFWLNQATLFNPMGSYKVRMHNYQSDNQDLCVPHSWRLTICWEAYTNHSSLIGVSKTRWSIFYNNGVKVILTRWGLRIPGPDLSAIVKVWTSLSSIYFNGLCPRMT